MKVKPLLQCHLLVTGLLPDMVATAPRLLALESLLAHSGQRECAEISAEAWVCRTFGVAQQDDWPVAPFSALGEGLQPQEEFWMRADPVYLQLQRDHFIVRDCKSFDLDAEEVKVLVSSLNQHFSTNGLQFFAPHVNRWYLRLPKHAVLKTSPLAEVVWQDANRFMPQGVDAMVWHGLLNEVQMLLHDHPVNLDREQRGKMPVNSVWAWGGGVLPKSKPSLFAAVWANDVLARGLTQASGSEAQQLPSSAGDWLEKSFAGGEHLIVLDALVSEGGSENIIHWCKVLQELEQYWFAPMLEALRRGKITRVHLHLVALRQIRSFTVEQGDLWKFWHRSKPLKAIL